MSSADSVASPNTTAAAASSNRGSGDAVDLNAAAVAVATAHGPETGRSLIVDESFFEEQFLRCQVCHERFDQTERAPKSLPCNHTFCLPCLTQIFDHIQPPARRTLMWADETLGETLKCPTCRVEIFLSRNKIKELPNDHRVIQMMDFLSQAVAKSQNLCIKHDRQPLNFFCKKCLFPVCRDCTVLDHKESEGHVITDVSEALNENSAQFSQIENKSRETLEKMKSRSDCLANASKSLDILERRLKNEIKETFIEYRLLLEKRQEALTAMVHQILHDQKSKINARFVHVCEHGTQLQKLYDEFKASRNSNDIRALFTINQQMKEHEAQFTLVASEDDNELFQSCEFEAQNEGSFLSDMSGLGEVRAKSDPSLNEPVSAHQLVYLDMEQQRERQRLIDSQLNYYGQYEEWAPAASYDSDDADAVDEEELQLQWRSHSTPMSRLSSHYAQQGLTHSHEVMDDDEPTPASTRRSLARRGRRSRDTNSTQVLLSLAPSRNDDLEIPRPPRLPAVTSSSGYGRSGSRSRIPGASPVFRVVRHPSSSAPGMRLRTSAEDSN